MGSNASRIYSGKLFAAMLALTAGAGTMMANNLTITPTASVSCNTFAGPGTAATINVKYSGSAIGTNTVAVTFTPPGAGLLVTAPLVTIISTANNNVTAGINFTVNAAAGCSGSVSAGTTTTTVQFADNATPDATSSVTNVVTLTNGTALVANSITLTCGLRGGVWTNGIAQTVYVTSAANLGTPFTVDESNGNAPPAWLIVTPITGGTASSTSVPFSVQTTPACNSLSAGLHAAAATIKLANAPAPDLSITVNVNVLTGSPLVPSVTPSLTYIKGSGLAGTQAVTFTSGGTPVFYSVYTGSLPIWLTVNAITGTTPSALQFSSTSICDTLAPGTYTATVYINVATFAPLPLTVSLLINNKAPKLSVEEGTTRNLTWVQGTNTPTYFVTAISSDSPIAYTVTTGGTLAPIISAAELSGLAYSYGTAIPINFNSLVFAAAPAGSILTGTVTLTWGSNPVSSTVVTFNITIQSPGAALTGISPASIPTAPANQSFNVILIGSGFVIGTDPTLRTKVGVVTANSNVVTADSNIAVNVANSNTSNLAITITVPQGVDSNLPFTAGGSLVLGVCTPVNGGCTIATGTQILTIGAGPILQAVTSASAYIQVTAPNVQSVAPYDLISLFGANFCPACAPPIATVLYGVPDATLRYPNYVSPDAASLTQRLIQVGFQTQGNAPVTVYAPVLFASNSQINVIVPGALSPGTQYNIVVSYGYGTVLAGTLKLSTAYPINIVATDPGVFTIGADGQGDAAALASSTYALISVLNPAGMRSTALDSDVVQLYVTGLGAPSTGADNSVAGTVTSGISNPQWSTDCISTASYLTSLNNSFLPATTLANVDGTIIQSVLLNIGRLPPCLSSVSTDLPTVTVGGQNAPVVYAGYVADAVPGLYQINFRMPTSTLLGGLTFTTTAGATIATLVQPVQLPVVITSNSVNSQGGVNMWVAPRLKVTAPLGTGITGTVGQQWISVSTLSNNNSVVAAEGTTPYLYSVSAGVLPAGVTLDPNLGFLSGIPAANAAGSAYNVTITVKDSATIPVTGSVTFTLSVAGGLVISGTLPATQTFGTVNATLIRGTAAGGIAPYLYSLTSPASLPTGMTIGSSTGTVGITALTPGGTYLMTIHASDATVGTALLGNLSFTLLVNLKVTDGNGGTPGVVSAANGVGSTITTVQATGISGTATYTLDPVSAALGWITIDPAAGTVAVTSGCPPTTTQPVTVTVTDSVSGTGSTAHATGTIAFNVVVI